MQLLQYNSFSSRLFSADTDDTLCDVIGCYGYDVNSVAAAAEEGGGAKDKRAARGRDTVPVTPIPIPMPTSRFSIFTCYLTSCMYCVCMEIQVFNLFHAS